MKLLNYTTTRFAFVLFVLLSVWAVFFYFQMLDEIYDSMDDGLENQKLLVIRKAQQDSDILDRPEFDDGYYTIQETSYEAVRNLTDTYRDTLMYMQNENEFEPVRLLESGFEQDGSYYKIKLITSMVEEDDLIEDLLWSLLWLYLGLILSILLLNNLVLRRVWDPFYKLLSQLKDFAIEQNRKIAFEHTSIEEFSLLNERVDHLLQKSVQSYISQKRFIENAAHELQTPLAISINKLELFIENENLEEHQLETLASVLSNLERLTRFNKALLLLSQIENQQFPETQLLNFNGLVKEVVSDFRDLSEHKKKSIEISEQGSLEYEMNPDLAVIMISNLVKNSLIHGPAGASVKVKITDRVIRIENSGERALPPDQVFSRFQKVGNEKKSTGLGLPISKAIAERFGVRLKYRFSKGHIFEIFFPEG